MFRNRYDLVHVHGIWMFHVFAARIAQLRGSATIISPHGMLESWILKRSAGLKRAVALFYQDRTLRRAKVIHALTEKERAEVAVLFPNARIEIVPNFVLPLQDSNDPPDWWDANLEGRQIFFIFGADSRKKRMARASGGLAVTNEPPP